MELKIKDKVFEIDSKFTNIDIQYLIQETESDICHTKAIIVKPTIKNFKFVFNYIKDKKAFKAYYMELKNAKKQNNKDLFNNYKFLYQFQKDSILKILGTKYNGFILSLQQGLGKTLTSLITSKIRNESNIWIVAPASLLEQWREEIVSWLKEDSIMIYSGTKLKRGKLYKNNYKYNIISYETLRNDQAVNKDLKNKVINSFMIFDESTKLKNKKTKLYKSFRNICLKNRFNLFLTGTPVNNALQDIDNVVRLIDKDITDIDKHLIIEEVRVGWGSNTRYFSKLVGYKNLEKYNLNIKPIYYRKTKEDAAPDLPKKNIISINVTQTPLHQKIAKTIIEEMSAFQGFTLLQSLECGYEILKASKSENAEIIIEEEELIELFDKLPKTINNPKLNILKDLLTEVNDSVLIFSRFKASCSNIALFLEKEFPNKKVAIVTSQTKNKNEIATKFKNKEIDFVIATETWAKGISFPDIDYLINFDISPSFEMYFQKQDRIHRINSKTPKFIYNLVGDVIEKHIFGLLEDKIKLAEQVTEGKAGEIFNKSIKNEVLKKLGWS